MRWLHPSVLIFLVKDDDDVKVEILVAGAVEDDGITNALVVQVLVLVDERIIATNATNNTIHLFVGSKNFKLLVIILLIVRYEDGTWVIMCGTGTSMQTMTSCASDSC